MAGSLLAKVNHFLDSLGCPDGRDRKEWLAPLREELGPHDGPFAYLETIFIGAPASMIGPRTFSGMPSTSS